MKWCFSQLPWGSFLGVRDLKSPVRLIWRPLGSIFSNFTCRQGMDPARTVARSTGGRGGRQRELHGVGHHPRPAVGVASEKMLRFHRGLKWTFPGAWFSFVSLSTPSGVDQMAL